MTTASQHRDTRILLTGAAIGTVLSRALTGHDIGAVLSPLLGHGLVIAVIVWWFELPARSREAK